MPRIHRLIEEVPNNTSPARLSTFPNQVRSRMLSIQMSKIAMPSTLTTSPFSVRYCSTSMGSMDLSRSVRESPYSMILGQCPYQVNLPGSVMIWTRRLRKSWRDLSTCRRIMQCHACYCQIPSSKHKVRWGLVREFRVLNLRPIHSVVRSLLI